MFKKINNIIFSAENSKTPLNKLIFSLIALIVLRIMLEAIVAGNFGYLSFNSFLYQFYYYIYAGLMATLIIFLFCREKIEKIFKMVVIFFPIILIAPIFDFFFAAKNQMVTGYLYSEYYSNSDIIKAFFSFWGNFNIVGVTNGMRVEIFLVLFMSGFYVFLKKKSLVRFFLTFFISYLASFVHSLLPIIFENISRYSNLNFSYDPYFLASFYFLFICLFSIVLLYLFDEKIFKIIAKGVPFTRIFHYILIFILGFLLYVKIDKPDSFSINDIFLLITMLASIFFSIIFIVTVNDEEDRDADLSNGQKPLSKGEIKLEFYKKLGYFSLVLALMGAVIFDMNDIILFLSAISLYYIFSSSPFRLKKLTFLSKFIIAAASLLTVVLGFFVFAGDISGFPIEIVWLFLAIYFPCINFIDIKDYDGDKRAGIRTLPVVLGLEKSKKIIGLFFLLGIISAVFILKAANLFSVIAAIAIGIAMYYIINKKEYRDGHVMAGYFLSFFFLMALYFLK